MTYRENLILIRHGQSIWNLEGRFTGWVDIGLTDQGRAEARSAGRQLLAAGVLPDMVFTSVLSRAITTADLALDEMGRQWVPIERSWRLNERHYGALAGLDREKTIEEYGPEQVVIWRRSFSVRPPQVSGTDELAGDERYADVPREILPTGESLSDVQDRLLPFYRDVIIPRLDAGAVVMLCAHGNSLRALVKHLELIDDDEIANLEIPTGEPRLYAIGPDQEILSRRILTL
jgi:2,3-bisphosphoglycerate-dependent phosphoglycerate mutase